MNADGGSVRVSFFKNKIFDIPVGLWKDHVSLTPPDILQRFTFHTHTRWPGKSTYARVMEEEPIWCYFLEAFLIRGCGGIVLHECFAMTLSTGTYEWVKYEIYRGQGKVLYNCIIKHQTKWEVFNMTAMEREQTEQNVGHIELQGQHALSANRGFEVQQAWVWKSALPLTGGDLGQIPNFPKHWFLAAHPVIALVCLSQVGFQNLLNIKMADNVLFKYLEMSYQVQFMLRKVWQAE